MDKISILYAIDNQQDDRQCMWMKVGDHEEEQLCKSGQISCANLRDYRAGVLTAV